MNTIWHLCDNCEHAAPGSLLCALRLPQDDTPVDCPECESFSSDLLSRIPFEDGDIDTDSIPHRGAPFESEN